jgi:hypothetical protein
MNVVQLKADFPSAEWKRDFADTLIRLCPDMNPDAADEVSDSQYLIASSVAPQAAAERYVALGSQRASGSRQDGPGALAVGS